MIKGKNILIVASGLLFLFGCNTHEKELQGLNHDRDSLMSLIVERDSTINDFIGSFTEVEKNLNDVTQKQNLISMKVEKNSGELKTSAKERINSEILAINDLMDKNKAQLAQLNRKLKNSNIKSVEFEKMVKTLNEQIVGKDSELVVLNSQLNSLNVQVAQLKTNVDTLGAITSRQSQTIDEQTATLHTAYFIVGNNKQLENMKVINKKGGLLGIGKTATLSDRIDNSKFTRIDYTQTMSIPINSEAKIVTTHPADSYELDKDVKNKNKIVDVRITNPEKFWSTSKYLVVIKD